MTLLATRRYVDRSQQGCLGTSKVVRRARQRVVKPGRRSRRPVAFLVTLANENRGLRGGAATTTTTEPSPPPPDPRPISLPQPAAYSRPFRICRGCMQPAHRSELVNAGSDRPRHSRCMPSAGSDSRGDMDA